MGNKFDLKHMGNLFAKIYGAYLEGYFSSLLFYPNTTDMLHTLLQYFFVSLKTEKHTQSLTFSNITDSICKIRYHVTHSRVIFFTVECGMIITYFDTHPTSTTAIYNMHIFFSTVQIMALDIFSSKIFGMPKNL